MNSVPPAAVVSFGAETGRPAAESAAARNAARSSVVVSGCGSQATLGYELLDALIQLVEG
jgi:hypothetical protein